MASVRGELCRVSIASMFSALSFFLNSAVPARLLEFTGVAFAAWGLLSGAINVFWVALSYRMLGRGYGVLVALLTASILLLRGTWFGMAYPPWVGLYGITSFALLGVLTEKFNGGLGNLTCVAVNWLVLGIHYGLWPSTMVVPIAAGTFLSGYACDKAAKYLADRIGTIEFT